MISKPCSECGELIPNAIPIDPQGTVICADCSGESYELMKKQKRTFPAESTDQDYHGGMFHRGEW